MKITVVDETTLFAELLRSALEGEGHDVRKLSPPLDEVEEIGNPDALIIHLNEFDQSDLDAVRYLRSISGVPVLILCSPAVVERLRRQLGFSVDAVLPEDQPLSLLIGTLTVLSGGYSLLHRSQIDPHAARRVPSLVGGSGNGPMWQNGDAGLSKRETVILAKLRDGFSNKEIANDLDISDSTVKVHLRSIFQKTRSKNRTQAAIWAQHNLD